MRPVELQAPQEPTVMSGLKALANAGYRHNLMSADGGKIRCADCDMSYSAGEAVVVHECRLEGASDPEEQCILMGVRCRGDCQGALLLGYGPVSSLRDGELLSALSG